MVNFILADNQELTAFALKTLIREHESATVHHAADKDELVSQLQKEERSIVVLDYTLFNIQDEEQLLIIIERFPRAQWLLNVGTPRSILLQVLLQLEQAMNKA